MAEKSRKPSILKRIKHWWQETIGELRKVTWPTPKEAWDLTKIVLIVTFLMSVLLGVMDFIFSRLIGLLVNL